MTTLLQVMDVDRESSLSEAQIRESIEKPLRDNFQGSKIRPCLEGKTDSYFSFLNELAKLEFGPGEVPDGNEVAHLRGMSNDELVERLRKAPTLIKDLYEDLKQWDGMIRLPIPEGAHVEIIRACLCTGEFETDTLEELFKPYARAVMRDVVPGRVDKERDDILQEWWTGLVRLLASNKLDLADDEDRPADDIVEGHMAALLTAGTQIEIM